MEKAVSVTGKNHSEKKYECSINILSNEGSPIKVMNNSNISSHKSVKYLLFRVNKTIGINEI